MGIMKEVNQKSYYRVCDPLDQIDRLNYCAEVQHDPHAYLMTNWELQMAKMRPVRAVVASGFVGASWAYYLTKNAELNRLRRFKLSPIVAINLAIRGVGAALVGDFIGRQLFVSQRRLAQHKAAKNELSKVMRAMPNARPYVPAHKKSNSYFFA